MLIIDSKNLLQYVLYSRHITKYLHIFNFSESVVEFDPRVKEGSKMYNTLPRSWRTQNLVTSSREMTDLDEVVKRKELIESKSPAELANISSLSDIPVPT